MQKKTVADVLFKLVAWYFTPRPATCAAGAASGLTMPTMERNASLFMYAHRTQAARLRLRPLRVTLLGCWGLCSTEPKGSRGSVWVGEVQGRGVQLELLRF